MKRATLEARKQFAAQVAQRDAMRGTAPLKERAYTPRPGKRLRLSHHGEIRAIARISARLHPETSGFWEQVRRLTTMTETANIEIYDATIALRDGIGSNGPVVNLNEDMSRALYALAWDRFEQALVEVNGLFNEKPTEQEFHFNRVKRLLWEVEDLKRYIDVLFSLTALPEHLEGDDPA